MAKSADAWFEEADRHYRAGKYEKALTCFDHVLKLAPQKYPAWYYRGNTLRMLCRYQDAIASFNEALKIKGDYDKALNGRGLALNELERYPEAIESYKKALRINSNYHQAWNNRGNALKNSRCYEEAIVSYNHALRLTKNQYWQAWRNRGWAFFYSSRYSCYQEALKNWDDGLQRLKRKTSDYQQGCGELYDAKGLAQYKYGSQQENPFPHWRDAETSYQEALKFLTFESFRSRHLEVLQALIKVCRGLGEKDKAQMLESEGSELLGRLLQENPLDNDKIWLSRKFAAFNQYRVDSLAELGNWNSALELAEQRKNLCLRWLRDNRWVDSTDVKASLAVPFLNSQTAAIYWHISPAAITTFIIKHNQPPIVLQPQLPGESQRQGYPAYLYQLQRFETWMKQWKQEYKDYGKGNYTGVAKETALWREKMEDRLLNELHSILEINRIRDHLQDVNNLILIPHRELHLLPLDYLFSESFTITYLPSFQIGRQLQSMETGQGEDLSIPSLLKVESMGLPFATIESVAISWLYPQCSKLQIPPVKQEALIDALHTNRGYFHFTGHGYHIPEKPRLSALVLAEPDKLTLGNIFDNEQLDLSQYQLICLSACETGITSRESLVDEYVGLVSGFLAKGAYYVVSSLWTVDERSTALLMIRFYHSLKQRETPAAALKQAKGWLRQLTYKALAHWYCELAKQLDDPQSKEYLKTEAQIIENDPDKMTSSEPVYAHPYYWAGFILTGKPV